MASSSASTATVDPLARIAPEWVNFDCSGEQFAVPMTRVREILFPQPVTRLPGCGPEVCGLIALRGRILTILDFGAALGLSPSVEVADHRLLMVEYHGELVGGAVDQVLAASPEPARVLDLDGLLDRLLT